MAAKKGISVPIYKIDVDAAKEVVGENVDIADLPSAIIQRYNKEKGETVYALEGSSIIAGSRCELYKNIKARPSIIKWVQFFQGSGIELDEMRNEMQHLVCFVIFGEDLFAYTAGQAMVSFERFVDISFPIEVGRRIAQPEVKGARSSQVTGSTLASNVHFRDPRRITYVESLDNVWTALSGHVRPEALIEEEVVSIFGKKKKIRIDVTGAVKLGPRVESPGKVIELIDWLSRKAEADLPEDDGWSGLDAIRVLNARKKKDLISRLKDSLAEKIFIEGDYADLAISHWDASLYDNATSYWVEQAGVEILESDVRPSLRDVVAVVEVNRERIASNLSSVTITTENADYGSGYGTSGNLLSHLNGEIRYQGKTYYLLSGKWYEVDAEYIEQVKNDFLMTMDELDLDARKIGLKNWKNGVKEGDYNESSMPNGSFINGDTVLTDNVELFDTLYSDDEATYIIHVKKGFGAKIRDVRSQVMNSANMIENDLRSGLRNKLKSHYVGLKGQSRVSCSESEFLNLFERPRVYVLAYGTKVKVDSSSIEKFSSTVARMEIVSLNSQFRQISSSESQVKLRVCWIKVI